MNKDESRYTLLFVTVNPHFTCDFTSAEEAVLADAIDSLAYTANAQQAFGGALDGAVETTDITRRALEVGPRRGYLHAHFIWRVKHTGHVHLSVLNRSLQWYFDVNTKPGTYVRASLMDARRLNYTAAKRSHPPRGTIALPSVSIRYGR